MVSSLNQSNNVSINLLAIVFTAFTLLAYLSFVGGVYKSWVHNILEIISILNLGLLSGTTLYQLLNDSKFLATTVSTSISFTTFIFIVFYYAVKRLVKLRDLKSKFSTMAIWTRKVKEQL